MIDLTSLLLFKIINQFSLHNNSTTGITKNNLHWKWFFEGKHAKKKKTSWICIQPISQVLGPNHLLIIFIPQKNNLFCCYFFQKEFSLHLMLCQLKSWTYSIPNSNGFHLLIQNLNGFTRIFQNATEFLEDYSGKKSSYLEVILIIYLVIPIPKEFF